MKLSMKAFATIVLLIGAALCGAGGVSARVPQPAGQESAKTESFGDQLPTPKGVLRVTTTLVEVTVVARDKHDQPVSDLKQDNFELFDEGKPQKIQFFTVQRAGAAPGASPVPASPSSVGPRVPPAHVFSNRSSEGLGPNSVSAILIDEINMMCEHWPWARDQLIKFLRQVEPGDRIGIYLMMPSGISVLQEVTRDCSALVERLASWDGKFRTRCMPGDRLFVSNAGGDLGLVLYGSGPAPGGLGGPGGANPIYFGGGNPNWDYAILSLKAIGAIINHLAGIPGRKNIIWLSNGFPVSDISYPYERDTLRAANQANVAIYSVEAQGLAPLVPSYPAGTAPSIARLASPTAPVGADVANMDLAHPLSQQWQMAVQGKHIILAAAQEALMEVSDRTGGRVFINTNDLTGAIRSAFDDSRTTYTLGFYPEEPRFDGKFHRLQVKVVGRPDVSLTYRRGYVDARGTGDLKSLLQDAVWSPLDGSGIALTARMDPGKAGYDLSVTIGPDGLSLQSDGNRWKGSLHIVLVQNDDQGGRYDYLDQPLDLALRQDTYQKMLRKGLSFSQRVGLNPKATSLRVIVLDDGSGNLGSLTIPVAPSKQSDNIR